MTENLVIFCNCQSRNETPGWVGTSAMLSQSANIRLLTVTDLCGVCALNPQQLIPEMNSADNILLLACHPRAVRLLLQSAGLDNPEKISFFNLLEDTPADLLSRIDQFQETSSTKELSSDPSWPAWYPVIDGQRCNACGQCAEFCLFGVYEKNNGSVWVVNPKGCKNRCPACARICPSTAIIFPKYAEGGSIGGSASFDEAVELQRVRQATDEILGNDIYQSLEQRKLKRRSIIREEALLQAARERDAALAQSNNK